LSTVVITIAVDVDPVARCMAAETLRGFRSVTAQIVDPEPLKNAPSAPAFSAAAMTRGKKGISLARNGW
jgi:hypothetical protein